MSERRLVRMVAVLTVALALATCDVMGVAPPGSRRLVIPVENMSAVPARLLVAEEGAPIGQSVGRAVPDTVPPGVGQDVVFTVPSGERWAIFVNPSADRGALIGARDVPPDLNGATPLTISVDKSGEPSVRGPGGPGWFGD